MSHQEDIREAINDFDRLDIPLREIVFHNRPKEAGDQLEKKVDDLSRKLRTESFLTDNTIEILAKKIERLEKAAMSQYTPIATATWSSENEDNG